MTRRRRTPRAERLDAMSFEPMAIPGAGARRRVEGADAVGGNCGKGPDELVAVIERMRAAAPQALLVAKSNAGMPDLVDMRAVYRTDPAAMATSALTMRAAGATIIGGCCGTTPELLAAMAQVASGGMTGHSPIDVDAFAMLR